MQSPEVRASHGPTIALAGKQFHRLWSAVGAIKLGTRADVLEQTVSTRVSLSEVLSDSDWTTRPPVFVVTYPGEVKELYGAFELINGVTTKPFLIAIEELE